MSSSNCLSRKKVLIIGGSSGVGYGVAEAALRSGAQVFIASSTEAKVRAAVNDLRSSTDEQEASIFGRTVDVSSGADLDNLVSWMKAMGNGEDIAHFVYTSGDNLSILPFLEIDIDVAKTAMNVRYWDCLRTIQAVYPRMKSLGREASITLTSGTVARKPAPGWALMAGIAGSVEAVARGLALDLAPVRVNCFMPGAVETPLWNTMPAEVREAALAQMAANTLTGKVGQPDDVAEAYLYLMRCAYVPGTSVVVDGGASLSST